MMSVKLEDWKAAYSQANFAMQWTPKTDPKFPKIAYRVAVALNGLKEHDKALLILEEIKDCGDNLVK